MSEQKSEASEFDEPRCWLGVMFEKQLQGVLPFARALVIREEFLSPDMPDQVTLKAGRFAEPGVTMNVVDCVRMWAEGGVAIASMEDMPFGVARDLRRATEKILRKVNRGEYLKQALNPGKRTGAGPDGALEKGGGNA